jgi:hypothetical protein
MGGGPRLAGRVHDGARHARRHDIFARHGVYSSHATFVDGFSAALWVAVGFSGLGVIAALLTAPRVRGGAPQLALAAESP